MANFRSFDVGFYFALVCLLPVVDGAAVPVTCRNTIQCSRKGISNSSDGWVIKIRAGIEFQFQFWLQTTTKTIEFDNFAIFFV